MNAPLPGSQNTDFSRFVLDTATTVDSRLQARLENLDEALREKFSMSCDQTAVGLIDLKLLRVAMLRPDRMMYGASVPKIGILLAYFEAHPQAVHELPSLTRHALGLMIKQSSNEMATRFSRELGLSLIQRVLNSYGFYDVNGRGGIWVGKHYGESSERIGDPIGDHSHAVTIRQLLRFYLLLEQGKLVSTAASAIMREIFDSPAIPHDPIKFVKGLSGREVRLRRKWGSWETWLHDSAVIQGPDRFYIIAGLTNHADGDDYLAELAVAVDDWMST